MCAAVNNTALPRRGSDASHAVSGRAADVPEYRLRYFQPPEGQDRCPVRTRRHRDVQCAQQVNDDVAPVPRVRRHAAAMLVVGVAVASATNNLCTCAMVCEPGVRLYLLLLHRIYALLVFLKLKLSAEI